MREANRPAQSKHQYFPGMFILEINVSLERVCALNTRRQAIPLGNVNLDHIRSDDCDLSFVRSVDVVDASNDVKTG